MIAVMEMANTDYILPIGDDEIIVEGGLGIIIKELIDGPDLVILNGFHVSSDLKLNSREHLPIELHNKVFYDPIEAFVELWDKMPLGSFAIKSQCILKLTRFLGTSHAYTGGAWEYLAEKFRSHGIVCIKCLSEILVLFQEIKKSWSLDAAKIMLHEIPLWFLALPHEYQQQICTHILPRYLSVQSRYINLLNYRAMGQLNAGFVNNFMLAFSDRDREKARVVTRIPVSIAKSMGVFAGLLRKIKTKIRNLKQLPGGITV